MAAWRSPADDGIEAGRGCALALLWSLAFWLALSLIVVTVAR